MTLLRLVLLLITTTTAFAGSETLFSNSQSSPMASGSGSVAFGSYNATSITITVSASAYGGSQQGGGRNYAGAASASIGPLFQTESVPNGSDPLSVSADISLTVTKGSDGSWYADGVNMGSGVTVGASAYVDGENAQGGAYVTASVSWTEAAVSTAPSISWISSPDSVLVGASYMVAARAHDAGGNLTQVNVWKNGQPFAFAGGGNGTDGESGNATTDYSAQTVTFTAQAIDSAGATSPVISHVVVIAAPIATPASQAPSITWLSAPANVSNQEAYLISAAGSDPDGNLAQVNIWKNGVPFAFAGGGNGLSGTSQNNSADWGPQIITFTAQAVDAAGNASEVISHTVSVGAAASQPPSITWLSSPSSVGNQQSYLIAASGSDPDGNLTQVNIWKDGIPFAFAGGGNGLSNTSQNSSTDSGPRSVTFTAQAVDAAGNASEVISHTVSVGAAASQPPSITWLSAPSSVGNQQPYLIAASGSDPDGNLAQVNIWKDGVPFAFAGGGNGLSNTSQNSSNDSGPRSVTFTAQAVDADGNASEVISHTVSVGAASSQPPSITWLSSPGSVGNQQSYVIAASGSDPDGNLAQVNIWKDGAPFAFAGGGTGFSNTSQNSSTDSGPRTVSFTAQAIDADGNASALISQTVIVGGSSNTPPTVEWISAPALAASGESYVMAARGWDADGNLASISIQRDGATVASADGGTGLISQVSVTGSESGPRTVAFTAVATDAAGASSGVISHVLNIGPPSVVSYSLATSAAPGGVVSGGGLFTSGATAVVSATPDQLHDFIGWVGDATGLVNPLEVLMDRSKSIQAQFAPKLFPLTTTSSTGGTVTGGGSYPYGTTVTLSATPTANYHFAGWSGDASGTDTSVAVLMTSARFVQARFVAKQPQYITFLPVPDQSRESGSLTLTASASSGLPVSFAVLEGPATVSGALLQVTGLGSIVIEASQGGDDDYLPAPSVRQTFSALAPARLRYRSTARTLLQGESTPGAANFLIEAR